MNCPADGSVLVMSERSGVEIDYCPTCRGVWLDRGELDKILERAAREGVGAAASAPATPASQPGYPDPRYSPPPQDAYGQQYDPRAQQYDPRAQQYDPRAQQYDPRYGGQGYDQGHRRKRKESWLSDLFD